MHVLQQRFAVEDSALQFCSYMIEPKLFTITHSSPDLTELTAVVLQGSFKLCTFMHLIHTGCSPSYMSELVTSTSSIASRSLLRSASSRRYVYSLRLVSSRASGALQRGTHFPYHSMNEITNHKAFKRELKTVLFKRAYGA